jgi:hypothetical protein
MCFKASIENANKKIEKMRITNDLNPIELILILCSPASVTDLDTQDFFGKKPYSSHDRLVEAWTEKINIVLELFTRFGHDVTPLQGLGDKGVDVLFQAHGEQKLDIRIGIQIKSNLEATANAASKLEDPESSLTRVMKRQFAEALVVHRVQEWWFVQCFDNKKHSRLAQTNFSELPPGNNNGVQVRHIGPRSAYAFLSRSDEDIAAVCTKYLCNEDEVLRAAIKEMGELSALSQRIVLGTIWNGLDEWDGDIEISQDELFDYVTDDTDDLIEDSLGELEGARFLTYKYEGTYSLQSFVFPALCALYFEGRVRHQMSPSRACRYAQALLAAEYIDVEDEFAVR